MEKIKSLLKMNDLLDIDERKKALDTKKSFVVVAPAGSGKTQLLIKRYLTLLQSVRTIDSVICLTYTKKATEEMRERVLNALKNCNNGNPKDENEAELFKIAKKVWENKNIKKEELINPHSFQISTFHSFCSNILKKYPGTERTPNFETLEENQAEILYSEALQILLSEAVKGNNDRLKEALARRLAALDEKIEDLRRQIRSLLKNRDRLINVQELSQDRYDAIIESILDNMSGNVSQFFTRNHTAFENLLQLFSNEIKNNLIEAKFKKDNLKSWTEFASAVLTKDGTPRKKAFPPFLGNLTQELKDFISSFPDEVTKELHLIRQVAENATDIFDEESLRDTSIIFDEATKIFYSLLKGNKKDFVDLELSALKGLDWINGQPSSILEKLQFKIDHILIDEAQDLSDIEYKIISKLIEGWHEGDGRTLFFVGDPKQSIYRFRKSNVALFSLLTEKGVVRKDEEDYKLIPLELKVNFRSEPQIIDFVNKTFNNYFKKDHFSDDVPYSPFIHHKGEKSDEIKLALNEIDENSNISVFCSKEEKELTGKFAEVVSCVSENLKEDETIGILYKQRSFFSKYHKALIERGIDVETIEEESLINSPAVKHILNFLKAILLKDDLYWLLLLGSPWIDLSQKEIFEIGGNNQTSWREKVLNSTLIEVRKREILNKATEDFYNKKGAINFLKHFEELSGYESVKRIYGLKGVEECREFFKILSSVSNLPPRELIERAESLAESSFSPPEPLVQRNKVQAMTIHKAKGLEFDYVFVLDIDVSPSEKTKRENKSPILVERLGFDDDAKEFIFLAAPYEKNELTYKLLSELDKKREESEYKRLYYVALTRAKRGLFLFGKLKENNARSDNSILKVVADAHSLTQESFIPIELSEYESSEDTKEKLEPPNPPSFEPQKIPFKIKRASEEVNLSNESHLLTKNSEEKIKIARAKGIAIHKILEIFAKEKNSVSVDFVKKLLKESNVKFDEDFANEILDEAQSAWNIDDFKKLRDKGKIITELPLEMEEDGDIVVGRIDLLILGNKEAFAIDYKTGNPGNDLQKWIESKAEEYRNQVSIYKKMVSLKENIEEEKIKTFILFTKISLLKEVLG